MSTNNHDDVADNLVVQVDRMANIMKDLHTVAFRLNSMVSETDAVIVDNPDNPIVQKFAQIWNNMSWAPDEMYAELKRTRRIGGCASMELETASDVLRNHIRENAAA